MIASMRSRYLKSESIREQARIGSRTLRKDGTQAVWACCSFGQIESLRKAGQYPSDPGWHRGPPESKLAKFNRHRLGLRPLLKAKCHNHPYRLCYLLCGRSMRSMRNSSGPLSNRPLRVACSSAVAEGSASRSS